MVAPAKFVPSAIDAEKAVLGAILLENELAIDAVAKLDVEKFSLDAHRRIFRHMCELSDAGKPIDSTMLMDSMGRSGELQQVGGAAYLSNLTDGVPRRSSIDHYIKLIRDKWVLRGIMQASESALARCSSDEPHEVLGDIEAQLLELRAERSQHSEVHVSGFIAQSAERLYETQTTDLVGFTTGIDSIDRATTGIRPGELWIVGALPGRGKTAFGMQAIATANASQGYPTMFFSLEMSRDQLGDRMLCAESGVEAVQDS
jgi:replicative DNA helicase